MAREREFKNPLFAPSKATVAKINAVTAYFQTRTNDPKITLADIKANVAIVTDDDEGVIDEIVEAIRKSR